MAIFDFCALMLNIVRENQLFIIRRTFPRVLAFHSSRSVRFGLSQIAKQHVVSVMQGLNCKTGVLVTHSRDE